MGTLIEIGMLIAGLALIPAGFGFGICLAFGLAGRGRRERPQAFRVVPQEPCWTEAIGGAGPVRFQRTQCVDDVLMACDAKAARGEFPIPSAY